MSGSRITREIRQAFLTCACAALSLQVLSALDPNRAVGQYVVTRWGRESFPGGAIDAIAQTPDGNLWIGAENGLVRFDGIGFRLIDHANEPSLPAGHVLGLAVDLDGVLWVRLQSPYLLRFRGAGFEQTYPENVPPEFTFAREEGAAAIASGMHGGMLIATRDGPLRYLSGMFTPVASSGEDSGVPTSVAETQDGAVWVGMRDTGLIRVLNGRASPIALPGRKVNVLLPGAGRELWIGTDSGLLRWDGNGVTSDGTPAALVRSTILALERDRDSNLWISTPTGITRLDSSGAVQQASFEGLAGGARAIFEDREGNLWMGGAEGLMQLRDTPFLSYGGVANEGGSLYVDASGRIWIAPSSGGLLWLRGAERRTVFAPGIGDDLIYSIAGGPGELWAGRKLGGVMQLREEDGVFQQRTFTARDGLAPGGVSAVHRSRDGSIWAGTLGGSISRIRNGRITTFTAADGLAEDAVTTIQEGTGGAIWAGTTSGLQSLRDGVWRRYSGEDGLPPGRVNSLALDDGETLWIGASAGLFYWTNGRFQRARNAPDSLRGEIYGLAADDLGNLWATTDRSVVSIPLASLLAASHEPAVAREYGLADGLLSTRGIRRDHAIAREPSGRIWFSLQGGLSVVNPSLPSSLAPAITRVESVTVDGERLADAPIARYSSSRRRVVFDFIGVSLTVPDRVRYRYRLEGYDSDWSQPVGTRTATYTNLPPARYTFRVEASNSAGIWNGPPASVVLDVEPQLTETWTFRLAVLCLTAAAAIIGYRYRMARVHTAMNMRFEERLAERARIARELHDTLLQSFQGLVLRLQVVDDLLPPGKAKDHLEQSLERADQAIAEGRNAVHDLRSTAATSDLAQTLAALGDELSAGSSADFQLVVEGPTRLLQPIIRDEIYRITREALRNAFSHAAARHVETEISYGERMFRLRIRDDGCGIPQDVIESGRPGHYGLSGVRERAEQIGAELAIWSRTKAGTEIELSIEGSIAYQASAAQTLFQVLRKKRG